MDRRSTRLRYTRRPIRPKSHADTQFGTLLDHIEDAEIKQIAMS
jgi:hypothetical protein